MKDLVITAPTTGIAPSQHVGYQDVRNLDIYSIPGVVRLNNLVAKKSGSTVTGLVKWLVTNPATPAEKYGLDDAGVVYKSTDSGATWAVLSGNTTTNAHGNGLAIWKNYLFVARDTLLDVCGDGTATGITSGNWTNGWKTIDSDVLFHPMLISKNDNNLYGGAGKYVFSLEELTTFAPGTAASYTFTAQALDLPPNYRIKCLEELGNNLMLGTWQGTNVYDIRIADIFPWDRSSVSFGQPISMEVHGVHGMKNEGNTLTVLAGIEGKVYVCDGVNSRQVGQIPNSVANIDGGLYLEFFPGAICTHKGRVFFGVSSGGSSTAIAGMGVYSINRTSRGNILVHEHTISTGSDGDGEILKIGAIHPVTRDNILISWRDASTYGIDNITTTSYTTSYGGFFISPLYKVGESDDLKKYTTVEICLVRPLRTNEGIKISFRDDLTDSFTDLLTWDFATYSAELSHTTNLSKPTYNIPACEYLQLKVSLTGTTTSPELRSVMLE